MPAWPHNKGDYTTPFRPRQHIFYAAARSFFCPPRRKRYTICIHLGKLADARDPFRQDRRRSDTIRAAENPRKPGFSDVLFSASPPFPFVYPIYIIFLHNVTLQNVIHSFHRVFHRFFRIASPVFPKIPLQAVVWRANVPSFNGTFRDLHNLPYLYISGFSAEHCRVFFGFLQVSRRSFQKRKAFSFTAVSSW